MQGVIVRVLESHGAALGNVVGASFSGLEGQQGLRYEQEYMTIRCVE